MSGERGGYALRSRAKENYNLVAVSDNITTQAQPVKKYPCNESHPGGDKFKGPGVQLGPNGMLAGGLGPEVRPTSVKLETLVRPILIFLRSEPSRPTSRSAFPNADPLSVNQN